MARHGRHAKPPGPLTGRLMLACGLVVTCVGGTGLIVTRNPAVAAPQIHPVAAPTGSIAPQPFPAAGGTAPLPAMIVIPKIGVRARVTELGLTAKGTLQVPTSTTVAGWYNRSARPGDIGSSIIIGHVDSRTGPGVFYFLSKLRTGEHIDVVRTDGSVAQFVVTAIGFYLKDKFPTSVVYSSSPVPELRLVTCGGNFDFNTGHYLSNVVVYSIESGA